MTTPPQGRRNTRLFVCEEATLGGIDLERTYYYLSLVDQACPVLTQISLYGYCHRHENGAHHGHVGHGINELGEQVREYVGLSLK